MREFLYNNSQHSATEVMFFVANKECHLKLNFKVSRTAEKAFDEIEIEI